MKNISVYIEIFNEEERIENFIKCFLWSDNLIIIDKSSTDKTEDIIKKYISPNLIYLKVPYSDYGYAVHNKTVFDLIKNEWFMPITASDLIDLELVDIIHKTINTENFNYDVINIPYKMYTFGICDKHSPWSFKDEYVDAVYRKNHFILSDRIHEERGSNGKRYTIKNNNHRYFYHLTLRNLNIFYERHIRYSEKETDKYDDPIKAKKEAMRNIFRAIKRTFFTKKTYKLGWDGFALALAYISYYIMTYLSVWQKFNKKGESVYQDITKKVLLNHEKIIINNGEKNE